MKIEKKKETIRIVKFFLFSVSAGIIEISVFALLNELTRWTYWPSYIIALTLSVLWNFTLNRKFTFQSASNVPVAMIKVAIFYLIFTPTTAMLGNYLAEDLRWNEYLVTAINMVLNLTTEYLYNRFFVFGKTIDTNDRAKRNHIN
ncbi:MAG: GtrA family protein [Anaerolineaceae bacterium]|nr:MAG: GtrA family protein [Anaerolineaceae bacterium]